MITIIGDFYLLLVRDPSNDRDENLLFGFDDSSLFSFVSSPKKSAIRDIGRINCG
jgi:hypothetical protein